jgi:hypothetical protein
MFFGFRCSWQRDTSDGRGNVVHLDGGLLIHVAVAM